MPAKKSTKIPFEKALDELEKLVDTMESGEQSLDELVTNYERGAKLIAHCEGVISDARKRLELITLNPDHSVAADTQNTPATREPAEQDNDDLRLL
ncbi:exodeoxyribonuclease VII small subunit [Persicirhabdus sediminis]|uniref:Exodeoxyribonuclease 7 small subunit n=1 Tax=Persicirhabdus sediminis TaxID=454144 RepID=A0A8J7SL36_9BACT|nr:exodeoxyribonuclease VII small subunit [Persicirhabdus sediminis]MBK1791170.1 exodeoxyribonuclease VII small subunit [Persicirhabdus sediminis]